MFLLTSSFTTFIFTGFFERRLFLLPSDKSSVPEVENWSAWRLTSHFHAIEVLVCSNELSLTGRDNSPIKKLEKIAQQRIDKLNGCVCVHMLLPGASGRVTVDRNADRVRTYIAMAYGPGNTSFYPFMDIDPLMPSGQVSQSSHSTRNEDSCTRAMTIQFILLNLLTNLLTCIENKQVQL